MSTPKEDKLAKLKFEDITMGMNVSQTKVRISLEGEEGCPGIQVDKAWLLRLRDRMTELAGKLVDEERDAYLADGRAGSYVLLRDHIRAVAAEMRAKAKATRLNTVDPFMSIAVRNAEISEAQLLERFADRLEGRES